MGRGATKDQLDYARSCRTYTRIDPWERLIAQGVERTDDGCLIYTGNSLKNGYPCIGIGGHNTRSVYGHHVAYERMHGPIPTSKQVHHHCEHPLCLEGDHLVALTRKEHQAAHGRGIGPCRACGSSDWYERPDGGRNCRECRRRRRGTR